MGGTFPALIWASVISAWEDIAAERAAETAAEKAARGEGDKDSNPAKAAKPKPTCRKPKPNRWNRKKPRPKPKPAPEPEAAPEAEPRSRAGSGARRAESGRRRGGGDHRAARPARPAARRSGDAGGAEAPGALDRFGDPDPGAGDDLGRAPSSGGRIRNGSRPRSAPLSARPMPSASVSLPGPRAEVARRGARRRGAGPHLLQAGGRLEGADQHRRRLALGLGDEVEQAVDPVGEVDVGAARRAEEGLGPRRSGRRRRGRRGRRARSSRSRRSCRRTPS